MEPLTEPDDDEVVPLIDQYGTTWRGDNPPERMEPPMERCRRCAMEIDPDDFDGRPSELCLACHYAIIRPTPDDLYQENGMSDRAPTVLEAAYAANDPHNWKNIGIRENLRWVLQDLGIDPDMPLEKLRRSLALAEAFEKAGALGFFVKAKDEAGTEYDF